MGPGCAPVGLQRMLVMVVWYSNSLICQSTTGHAATTCKHLIAQLSDVPVARLSANDAICRYRLGGQAIIIAAHTVTAATPTQKFCTHIYVGTSRAHMIVPTRTARQYSRPSECVHIP